MEMLPLIDLNEKVNETFLQVRVRAVGVDEHHDPGGAALRRLPHGAHRTHDALLRRALLETHPKATPHDPHRGE